MGRTIKLQTYVCGDCGYIADFAPVKGSSSGNSSNGSGNAVGTGNTEGSSSSDTSNGSFAEEWEKAKERSTRGTKVVTENVKVEPNIKSPRKGDSDTDDDVESKFWSFF